MRWGFEEAKQLKKGWNGWVSVVIKLKYLLKALRDGVLLQNWGRVRFCPA